MDFCPTRFLLLVKSPHNRKGSNYAEPSLTIRIIYLYIYYMLVESQKTSIFLVVYTDSVNCSTGFPRPRFAKHCRRRLYLLPRFIIIIFFFIKPERGAQQYAGVFASFSQKTKFKTLISLSIRGDISATSTESFFHPIIVTPMRLCTAVYVVPGSCETNRFDYTVSQYVLFVVYDCSKSESAKSETYAVA